MIVTSNKPFSGWGEIFGDEVTAAAMIDRLVHHAEILALKGDSYRLKDRDLARATADRNLTPRHRRARWRCSASAYGLDSAAPARTPRWPTFQPAPQGGAFSTGAEGCIFDRP